MEFPGDWVNRARPYVERTKQRLRLSAILAAIVPPGAKGARRRSAMQALVGHLQETGWRSTDGETWERGT